MYVRVDRPGERAYFHFVVVARVDEHHVRVADQCVPVLRFHISTGHVNRADAVHAHGDDFFFQTHFHAVKRRLIGIRLFVFQISQTRVGTQVSQHRVHVLRLTGNRAVNAFARQQNHAFDMVGFAKSQQRRFHVLEIRQVDKLVKSRRQKNVFSGNSIHAPILPWPVQAYHGRARQC